MKLPLPLLATTALLLTTGFSAQAQTVPGVMIQPASSQPHDPTKTIRIRCSPSLTQHRQPLFIIDGKPLDPSANLSDVSPDSIEKVEVIKAPAAAVIYGSRAEYGVILITTKAKPKRAKPYPERPMEAR
ncbi:TonB-dependent receptor plug domain-containing protein [Hymenobacter sp. BT175]|uniref:TonB-dependent receptor plug domain-containing protein n=1 Tax=Hymenobacter translucens TaxID=2886507 RepID=UPI001D0E20C7|nr:TonB-dependent receptor plug domain-containing protein [Hymenobacter translucens]MCC2545037.1 TonB-dependent receptor plug domain-containing protein [Hymenobacter translucens]